MNESHDKHRIGIFWFLIIGMLCWTFWVLNSAVKELRGGQIVQGLTRTYAPPYEHPLGWVIDPRTTSLADELVARFGRGQVKLPNEPWQKTIRRIGLRTGLFDRHKPLTGPSLLVDNSRIEPDLWIGRFGLKHVLFRSSIGVLTVDELPAYSSVISLDGAGDSK